uniref:cytosolic phospholipase A2 isoform X2 n=1 Tax=Ciona intestinalis TaxID=7719 RepID=UPI00089DB276|nr:cytosolic phospholipase A2 isoform X2 [Ciona intestinalis]|eukprot:XP_018669042.1 cytosolic phospholipase A2 isoform X2 [Ciona intestinalis]
MATENEQQKFEVGAVNSRLRRVTDGQVLGRNQTEPKTGGNFSNGSEAVNGQKRELNRQKWLCRFVEAKEMMPSEETQDVMNKKSNLAGSNRVRKLSRGVHFNEEVTIHEPPATERNKAADIQADIVMKYLFEEDKDQEKHPASRWRGLGLAADVTAAMRSLASRVLSTPETSKEDGEEINEMESDSGYADAGESPDELKDEVEVVYVEEEDPNEELDPPKANEEAGETNISIPDVVIRPAPEIVVEETIETTEAEEEECLKNYLTRNLTVEYESSDEDSSVMVDYQTKYSLQVRGNGEKTDPFQFFEVAHEPCHVLKVRVLCGRNITKGRLGDYMDTPDPYVVVHIRTAPDGRKATRHIDNDINPEWNEELSYLLPTQDNVPIKAEINLMDANYAVDEKLGCVEFDVSKIPRDETVLKTFSFNETSEVDIEFTKELKYDQDIRSSLALCKEEKEFRSARKRRAFSAMRNMMTAGGPRSLRETPTIAILGSGGGFRAMTGMSGAVKALNDSGILNCATYICGLSGSSWYLSVLFAHGDFPSVGTSEVNAEIRRHIASSPFWLLRPECLMRYSHRLHTKMKAGQPVTFTDFFGLLIGQTLLGPERMETAKLTDFQEKVRDGKAPLPILTCLHVRPDISAMTFHDWVEFSPYEIGMAKYGTFMKSKYFGSKFYMGVLAKEYEEYPLHFLMGVWGSAFSILFNRLVEKSQGLKRNSPGLNQEEDMRTILGNKIDQSFKRETGSNKGDISSDSDDSDDEDKYWDAAEEENMKKQEQKTDKRPSIWGSLFGGGSAPPPSNEEEKEKPKKGGFFNTIIGGMFGTNFMESREYRAGKILNYMRGIVISRTYPISPFSPLSAVPEVTIAEANEFGKIHEPMEVKKKKVHLVDAGLTFNSPYPCILRPQRAVDLIISFDFSGRPSEVCEPFKEILLAEKWARMHHLPFPKIDRTVYDREGMKECYIFQDHSDDRAPVIMHFVLCNIMFRKYSKPGVKREAGDTRGDFNIYDPKSPYSTFNFQYPNEAFDRLHELMEFNTLLHIEDIKDQIRHCISLRRHSQSRCSITLNDIRNSFHMSDKNKRSLERRIIDSGSIPLD